MRYTFVTVVYELELGLLELQAKSFELYLPRDLVYEIIVINNSPKSLSPNMQEQLISAYGHHADSVRILNIHEFASIPLVGGWRSQQIAKLKIANLVTTPRYVVLDAKMVLLHPLSRDFLEAPDGRALAKIESFADHKMRPALEKALIYMRLDIKEHVSGFMDTLVPFVFYTKLVQEMILDIESRCRRSFETEFVRYELTEFFLYGAWLVASGRQLEALYSFNMRYTLHIFRSACEQKNLVSAIERINALRDPFFSIHRDALIQFGIGRKLLIAEFWASKGIFESERAGIEFFDDFQRQYRKSASRARTKLFVTRSMTVWRRVMRKIFD